MKGEGGKLGRGLGQCAAVAALVALATPAAALDFDPADPLGFEPLGLSGASGVLWAAGGVALTLLLSRPGDPPRPPQGEVHVTSDAAWFRSIHEARTDVWTGRVGLVHQARRWFSWGGEVHATGLRDARISSGGAGGVLVLRWHPGVWRRGSLWFEYGIGMIALGPAFPPGGSHVNFTPTYGLGGRIEVMDGVSAHIGVRHLHISNAGLFGPGNPGFDSNGIVLGFELTPWR